MFEWWSKTFTTPNPVNFGALSVSWRREAHTIHDAPAFSGDTLQIEVFSDVLRPDQDPAELRSSVIDIAARASVHAPLDVAQEIIRLKSGFKSRNWWFILTGNVVVENVKMGETGKDLKEV